MKADYVEKFMDESRCVDDPAAAVTENGVPLSSVVRGSRLIVTNIPEGRGRTQLIRLGIMRGEVVTCAERLPGGTVVVEKNRQEVAIGSSLAETILVDYACAG